MAGSRFFSRSQTSTKTTQPHRSIRSLCAQLVARGKSEWVTALPRANRSWLQGFFQSHVQLPGNPTGTSIRRTTIGPIEVAKAQKRSLAPGTTGELFCTARHLDVRLPTREARPGTAGRTDADQAGQSKRRGRLRPGTSVHADDPRAYRTAVG